MVSGGIQIKGITCQAQKMKIGKMTPRFKANICYINEKI